MGVRRALLIVDLEGVAGVDTPGALISGTPGYARSRELLAAEVNAAVEGLLAAGFQRVRVSDSHLSGSGESNLSPEALHPSAELCFHAEDAYDARFFEDIEAVACLGMHAPGGAAGFGAHTVDLLGAWSCAGRSLSEAELVLGLAAEAGVPAVFVSGDDVLQAHLGSRVPYVRTKTALSVTRAFSRSAEDVLPELTQAAAQPARPVEPLPDVPLVLSFKSGYQAALATGTGAQRLDRYRVVVVGRTFRERYTRALQAASAAGGVLGEVVEGVPGDPSFTRDATALFRLPASPVSPLPRWEAAERALRAFLSWTEAQDDENRALRALTLHMLEGHAPGVFARWNLRPTLDAAVAALAEVPLEFLPGLPPEVGMSRLDAWYVRRERGLPHTPLAPTALRAYLEHLHDEGASLFAWLLGEMTASCGLDLRLPFPARAFRGASRLMDLYWLTHLYLLDTRYLHAPVRAPDAVLWTEELLVATPWLVEQSHVDLAAEVAFCLQCTDESGSGAHEALLSLLVKHQQADGRMEDAHSTAGALLAFAGAEERRSAVRADGES